MAATAAAAAAAAAHDVFLGASPRFTVIDPDGPLTHDLTTVDVVAVPCPGADAHRSWARDGLMSRYHGALSMRDAQPHYHAHATPRPPSTAVSWVRHGVRRENDRARILLYEHPERDTLAGLADALVDALLLLQLQQQQQQQYHHHHHHYQRQRPLLFMAHSLGGLVVKMALVRARKGLLRDCYGVAFFGTPHQGSSYLAMPSLATSIQSLLQLSWPLPASITDDLRVGNPLLAQIDQEFKAVAQDLQIWTFYETIPSRLSGGSVSVSSESRDVYFTAPLTSTKSAILGMRQERVYPLKSDHANVASFGRHNLHTLRLFLKQLAREIDRADANVRDGVDQVNWNLGLEQRVSVEVHGFFDDTPPPVPGQAAQVPPIVRTWSTRVPLTSFLNKGPEVCLRERLNEVEVSAEPEVLLRQRGGQSLIRVSDRTEPEVGPPRIRSPHSTTVKNVLGLGACEGWRPSPASPVIRPVIGPHLKTSLHASSGATLPRTATPPTRTTSPLSHPGLSPSPLVRADFEYDLAIDQLSPPLHSARPFSAGSDGLSSASRDLPPVSDHHRSVLDEACISDDASLETLPRLPEAVVAIRKVVEDLAGKDDTVILDGVPRAFKTPSVDTRKFIWVHVPFNNPTWVKSVLQTLEVSYQKDYSALYGQDFWMTRHTRGRHAQHYAYFASPGCYFSSPQTLSPRHRPLGEPTPSSMVPGGGDSTFTCLFLPYLHFDSYKRLIRRRDLITQRLKQGRSQPVPESVAKSDSLELQVIWEFLGHDPPINCRRTLDQYEYPSLRDTRSRDDDQMLYKLTKERFAVADEKGVFTFRQDSSNGATSGSGRSEPSSSTNSWRERVFAGDGNDNGDVNGVLNGNVLMVDQLWLWVIQSHTIVSFFPKRESDPIEGPLYQQADLRESIFNEVNVDLTRQCENAFDLAALAALHAVSVLLDRSSHPGLEVFRILEEAISLLTERLTSSLKEFRAIGFRDKASDYEPAEDGERSIRKRHKEEGRRAERENRDNTSALLELRDIEDELQTLLHLFERQSKVIMSMQSIFNRPDLREQTTNGRGFLIEAIKRLREYAQQANEMMQRVRATRDDYDKLLQMVQRQAQVDEVRLSRLHADLASAQSRSVMIFTTFTVIFLPLTFFTGLFGMNTREWGGDNNLSLKTIGMISLPASTFLVIASLVIAFSSSSRRFFGWAGSRYRGAERWMYLFVWRPMMARLAAWADAVLLRSRRNADGERDGAPPPPPLSRRHRKLDTEVSDFWERNQPERDRGYKIPAANKKRGGWTTTTTTTGGTAINGASENGKGARR